jgi:pyruvate dehydrogenase E1 component alpha subunit
VPVASQCQHAMGIAWGSKLRKDGSVCTAFVGDGGTSEGDFHEAMNFAAVFNVPMIMIVQNNQWAISIPREKQTASATIAQKAIAYGIDGVQVDGNDILAMIVATGEAVEKARTGGGPTLIEAVTYRLSMHTTADDPKKYRSEDEVKPWEAKDPLIRFRNYLIEKKLLSDKVEKVIEEEIHAELTAAVKAYEAYQLDTYGMFKHMYKDMTPELSRQMSDLKAYLEGGKPENEPASTDFSRVM